MKSCFFIKDKYELKKAKQYILLNNVNDYIFLPVSDQDPHFFDNTNIIGLKEWENRDFLDNRIYSWIYKYRQNHQIFDKLLGKSKELPYYESVLFYLSCRYEKDYFVFVDMLVKTIKKFDIEIIYIFKTESMYLQYIKEANLIHHFHIKIIDE